MIVYADFCWVCSVQQLSKKTMVWYCDA